MMEKGKLQKIPNVVELAKDKMPEIPNVVELAKDKMPEIPNVVELARDKMPEIPNVVELAKDKIPEIPNVVELAKDKIPEIPNVVELAKDKAVDVLPHVGEEKPKVYPGIDQIPSGDASEDITEGCLVLEGGAFRGLYTQGVLDALMEENLNFQTTIGISAGALSGIPYVAGRIGWSARMNLTYRHDPNYIGKDAIKNQHGITGFSYMFQKAMEKDPLDRERFMDPRRRFLCVATNMRTGQPDYFEKGKCKQIFKAVQASATVPYVSRPVVINHTPYLDGGVVLNIPYHWAKREKFQKIVVVKTRDRSFRKDVNEHRQLNYLFYHHYPNMLKEMTYAEARYDCLLDEIDTDEAAGQIFVLAPGTPVEIGRFEGDMEKLGDLYWQGYYETKEQIPALRAYLSK